MQAANGGMPDDLEVIADLLRRQRRDLEEMIDSTASRSHGTAELVRQIDDLRRRSEETLRRFESAAEALRRQPPSTR